MPIAQMQRYAGLCRDDTTMAERLALLEEHDRAVGARIAELQEQRVHLKGKMDYYRSLDTRSATA